MNRLKLVLGSIFLTLFTIINAQQFTVVIDAGHGGADHGAQHNEFSEKDITLDIANYIQQYNQNSNLQILFTRQDDSMLSLADRVNQVNKLQPNLMISLHVNTSSDAFKNGIEIYTSPKNTSFAENSIQSAIGFSEAFRNQHQVSVKDSNFYMLKNTNCPGILVEMGFLSNPNDRLLVTSEEGKQEMAKKILNYLDQMMPKQESLLSSNLKIQNIIKGKEIKPLPFFMFIHGNFSIFTKKLT